MDEICRKYLLRSRAEQSHPYLQPRVQARWQPHGLARYEPTRGWREPLRPTSAGEDQHVPNTSIPKPPSPGVRSCHREDLHRGDNSCRTGLSGEPAGIWLGGSAPATRHWHLWRREGGGGWTATGKKYPKFCKVLLTRAAVLAFLPCAKDLAEPTRLKTLHSKLEEFVAVQGSPPNFASIPQQRPCLLNILWV